MTCDACQLAEEDAHTGRFNAQCLECEARAIAQSPEAFQRETDYAEALQALMRKTWPDKADYRKGRVAVWNWIKRLSGERTKE